MTTDDADDVSTVHQQRYDPTPPGRQAFVVTVESGVDADLSFKIEPAEASPLLAGTSPACQLRLRAAQVSRRHASFEVRGETLQVTDLESTNGTRVNGVVVGVAFLRGGETLELAGVPLRVQRVGADAAMVVPTDARFGRMIGVSREMRRLYPLCKRVAASTVPALIEGETGVGKEILAESLHEVGPRSGGPFVVFDCAAVAPSLVEAELFGHERGAFTGANALHKGVFELAHGGTLLIDEIGDLAPNLQPKLLRVLERAEFRRVGGERNIKVDVRVLAATRRDLDREVEAGRFRDDLFHRLAVARVELPPLRARKGDVGELARVFCTQLGGDPRELPPAVIARWEAYAWPGNVRELRNRVARFLALGELGQDAPLPVPVAPSEGDVFGEVLARRLPLVRARQLVVDAFERRYLEQVLSEHDGVVSRAAAASGIARRHFYRIRQRVGG